MILWPRLENPNNQATYKIIFGTTAQSCAVMGTGYNLQPSNIADNGISNSFDTVGGDKVTRLTGTGATAVQTFQSIATSLAKHLRGLDSGGSEMWNIDGQGFLSVGRLTLTNNAVTTAAPSAGGAGALPATPSGYYVQKINGTDRKIPYY